MRTVPALLLALALAGCATTNPQSPGTEMAVFDDIPAAPGMTYESGYGHRTPSGDLRTYSQVFTGSRRSEDVRRFYEEALPVHQWKLMAAEGTDRVTLTFEKRAERCTIIIEPSGNILKVRVTVGGRN
ncbi:MAG TPA: hypothetical protein VK661_05740 [Planctomycetota bacterium]|jgi:hypothetical protein|nr:hypothetical protein [Planctomycetota bacterium]